MSQKKFQTTFLDFAKCSGNSRILASFCSRFSGFFEKITKSKNRVWNFFWDKIFEILFFPEKSFYMIVLHHPATGINPRGSLTLLQRFGFPTEKPEFPDFAQKTHSRYLQIHLNSLQNSQNIREIF